MDIIFAVGAIILGLMLLVKGADWLVSGAASLARRLGVAPIVVGLTVVAFGTSMPELVVNLFAAVRGSTDIAIGNIVGSNIANILLILGISAAIYPLQVKKNTVWKEIPLALLGVLLVYVMANDMLIANGTVNLLDRIDGLVFLAFFIVFLYYTFGIAKVEGEAEDIQTHSLGKTVALIAAGLFFLILGGKLTVDGAIVIAQILGISQRVIGLTIVAVGTSLPELVTSALAAYRHHADIAIGNVVGSNIFNIFWILGTTSIIRPLPFSSQNSLDVLVGIGATFILFLAMFVGKKHLLERWQGIGFIIAYLIYVGVVFFYPIG